MASRRVGGKDVAVWPTPLCHGRLAAHTLHGKCTGAWRCQLQLRSYAGGARARCAHAGTLAASYVCIRMATTGTRSPTQPWPAAGNPLPLIAAWLPPAGPLEKQEMASDTSSSSCGRDRGWPEQRDATHF